MIRRGGWTNPALRMRAADALARLLERGVREADDGEPGQPRRDVDLDPDEPAVEAVERRGRDDRQHDAQPTDARSPGRQSSLTRALSAAYRARAARVRAPAGRGSAGRHRRGCRDRLVDRPREMEERRRRAPNRPW